MCLRELPKPPQAPPLFTATPSSIVENARLLIERARKVHDQIAENVQPNTASFANVLLPLAHAENAMAVDAHILGFYRFVSPDSSLRDASGEAQKLLDDFAIETAMREDLYNLVDVVLKRNEDLDPESHRLLVKAHKEYVRNGLNIPAGAKRDRFKEIKKRLSQVALEFRKNLVEESGGLWFLLWELDGVPEDVLTGLEKGVGVYAGKLRLTFKYPDLYPALRYAKNGETRKRIYIAHDNKCNQNVSLFKEAVVLRDEAARLLGYLNHAVFRLEDKMAKTPRTVNVFLSDLQSKLTPGGKKELENLKQLKKADVNSRGESFDGSFYLWDYGFYNRLMLEKQYAVDQQRIAEYFPLQIVVHRIFKIFEHLFGLVFVDINSDKGDEPVVSGTDSNIVWHKDVQVFSVWDDEEQGNGFLGYLYLDLFPREGKHGHTSNFNLQPGFIQEDGTRRYPTTALVCNFTKPTPDKPSLLKYDEVVNLFHELGHGIHDLVSKTIYSRFHGTNTVIDFGEAPSQMLENWCWLPSQLKSLSKHYSSFEEISDEQIESIIKARNINIALFNLRQLHLGIFDMMVHEPESHEAIENMNISALHNSLRKDVWQIDGPEILGQGNEWGHDQANYGHLLGDYDAGYYGYLFSKVFSTDMFYTVFKPDPMNAQEGRRYRYSVLEKGGSQDEMKILTEFLGRKPQTDAFYQDLGLA